MTARKLITNLRDAVLTNTDLYERVALAISVLEDAVDVAELVVAHRSRHIAVLLCASRNDHARRNTKRHNLTDQDILRADECVLGHEAIRSELPIIRILYMLRI